MHIPVLVEQLPDRSFRARAGDPFALCAEGKTQTEALNKLRKLIEERRKAGAWIVHLDIGNIDNPLMRSFGTLDPNDPAVQAWEKAMAENRRKADEDPDFP
jgi:hypothetical protein